MRNSAAAAILNAVVGVAKIAAAVFFKAVQRTEAKQAAEFFQCDSLMAGKIFTVSVAEIF